MRRLLALGLFALLALVLLFTVSGRFNPWKAERSPQAAVYRAYVKAVRAGNVEAWKMAVSAQTAGSLGDYCEFVKGTPEQAVASFAGTPPDEFRFTGISTTFGGDEATLWLKGTRKSGKKVKGEILFVREYGIWKIKSQGYDQ